MNIPIDSKGRYVRTISQHSIKIPPNIYEGCNTPTTNSVARYRKTDVGSSSSWKPKGRAIEGRETLARSSKDPIPEEVQEGHPFEILNSPLVPKANDTTFSLVGDSKFVNFIDVAQVNALFGSSINTFVS